MTTDIVVPEWRGTMTTDSQLVRDVNRLYWQTDASVADIADQLDISRRALYDAIEPAQAGRACPECGSPMEFRNRTAQTRGEAECPNCGLESDLDTEPQAPEGEAARRPGVPLDLDSMDAQRVLRLAGAVLAGIAAGAIAAVLGRRLD